MIIVGINPGYDSTAAVLVDGEIAAIVEEERLSRVKNHLGFPLRAIPEALRVAGVKPTDVDLVTFSFVEYLHANTILTELMLSETGVPFDPENPLRLSTLVIEALKVARPSDLLALSLKKSSASNHRANHQRYVNVLNAMEIPVDSMLAVDHHLSHAASAYYTSGFDDCLVVTADGCGDGLSGSVSLGRRGILRRIATTPQHVSSGLFYGSITSFLGFKTHRHEGKITGLAAYGNPESCYRQLEPCLTCTGETGFGCDIVDGSLPNRLRYLGKVLGGEFFRSQVVNDYHHYFERALSTFSREDIAAAAQKRLEDVFVDYLAPIVAQTGMRRLALAGGVFANVKLNQRLLEMAGIEEVYVHPNMGDGGNALGSAFVAYGKRRDETGARPYLGTRLEHVYFGPEYSDAAIEAELRSRKLKYRRDDDIETLIGSKVAEGYIVGRFNGRMEYGPRALGNRSILANPTSKGINKTLNDRLRRTEFMPFAPSVLAEDAHEYFDVSTGNAHPAEFMTITCSVHSGKRETIPAVSHVDGTARPHIVRADVNPSFHKIIEAFKAKTGLGVVVNTSFNVHEEPIVCAPADACRALEKRAVDYLAIGKFWIECSTE